MFLRRGVFGFLVSLICIAITGCGASSSSSVSGHVHSTILKSTFNESVPTGQKIAIKNVDYVRTDVSNLSYTASIYSLDVYLYVAHKFSNAWIGSEIAVFDASEPQSVFGADGKFMGYDENSGFYIYKVSIEIEKQSPRPLELSVPELAVDLYARLILHADIFYSNQNSPNSFFKFVY